MNYLAVMRSLTVDMTLSCFLYSRASSAFWKWGVVIMTEVGLSPPVGRIGSSGGDTTLETTTAPSVALLSCQLLVAEDLFMA